MAVIKLPTLRDRVCNGTFGNLNSLVAKAKLTANAATGSEIHFSQVDASTRIDYAELVCAATDGTKVQLFAEYVDGSGELALSPEIAISGTALQRVDLKMVMPAVLKKDAVLKVKVSVAAKSITAGDIALIAGTVFRGPQG